MRKWKALVIAGVLMIVLLGVMGCERSKLPPAPTLQVTSQAVPTTAGPTPTVGVGETVIAADATETLVPDASTTPIPEMTPTTAPTTAPGEPTNTPEPTATAEPGATATPTTDAEFEYTVQTGDTLWGLAIRFGTTVDAIKSRNGLTSSLIYKGNKLIIPGTSEGGTTVTHVVQAGENLFRISLKYGTTIEAIAARNGIVNPRFIYVGQKLTIPQGSTPPSTGVRYHVVQPGENLSSIAMRYGTTPWKIAAANGISNINFIYAGRTLRIP